MAPLVFATLASPGPAARHAVLLASSLRHFGGRLANSPLKVLVPEGSDHLGAEARADLARLAAEVVPVALDAAPPVPFSLKVAAAAAAEERVRGTAGLLAWLDADTLVLGEPAPFLLPTGVALGYRPVHHRLIGLPWEGETDGFWQLVWAKFGVSDDRQSPMTTSVGERIRPYLNAGIMVVRPERGLLAAWREGLAAAVADPGMAAHCEASSPHAVFLHQVVLTAVALGTLRPEEMADLGPQVNYPLHLHEEVPPGLRPAVLDGLITARYENVFADPAWRQRFPMSSRLAQWLGSSPLPGAP